MIYLAAFSGWLLYIIFDFSVNKDKDDVSDKSFMYKNHFFKRWDNWLFSFLLAPWFAYDLVDILALIEDASGKKIPFFSFYYLLVGVFTELFYLSVKFCSTTLVPLCFKWVVDRITKMFSK